MRFGLLFAGLALTVPGALYASQSLSAGSGTTHLPSGSPFTALTTFRVEFRLHGAWNYTISQTIYGTSSYAIRLLQSNQINITSWRDGRDCWATVPAGTDIIVRLQRTPAQFTAEAVSPQTGLTANSLTCTNSNPGTPNDAGSSLQVGSLSGALAYLRVYSTTVPMGTVPDNTTCTGNLVDYEFEGNTNDCSGNGVNLSPTGATYSATPILAPAVTLLPWPTITALRANKPAPLNAAAFSTTDNAVLSYFWQQLSGPAAGTFSSRTVPNPIFTVPMTGLYRVQLAVKDNLGATGTGAVDISAAATDSRSVVVSPQPDAVTAIVGPVLQYGQSPWIFGDLAEIATGESIATTALANPPALGTQLSGTATITHSSATILGTGTHFVSELAGKGQFIVAWNSVDGPGTGRALFSSWTVTDDTHISLSNATGLPTQSGLNVYLVPPATASGSNNDWVNGYASTFWSFYDPAMAFYRIYDRTGDVKWLNWARQFADINWQWMIDHGSGYYAPPRGAQILSQFVRAADGHPERFPGLLQFIQYYQDNFSFNRPSSSPNWDTREAGYIMWWEAVAAKTDSDATRHAQYCTYVNNLIPQWINAQTTGGWWAENTYSGNPGYPYGPYVYSPPVYGTAPWRMALAIRALEANYEVLSDTSSQGCNNPALAASLLTSITKAVAFVRNYGRDSQNRGIYYDVQYSTNAQVVTAGTGTVSATLNSDVVTGSGTSFQTLFSCGADYIGFSNSRSVYKVTECPSSTTLRITPPFGSSGETTSLSGSPYSRTIPSGTNCQSQATYCNAPGDRNLTRLVCGATGWLYHQTGNPQYLDWTDECVSATLGGPSAGPTASGGVGQFSLPCSGTGCDGYIGDYVVALRNCSSNPAPCTPGGSAIGNFGKNFGEAFGAPGIDNALAWRLGGLTPEIPRTLNVSFSLASVPQAAKVRIALTKPSGATATTICSSSPCTIQGDARQGDHLVRITYLSATDATLSTGDQVPLRVR